MILYRDTTLKEKMENNSKKLLIKEFSIRKRNEGLKAVYDKIFELKMKRCWSCSFIFHFFRKTSNTACPLKRESIKENSVADHFEK